MSKPINATHTITATIGIILAISGFNHGFFEALQGFKSTNGLVIQAIDESVRWWKYGTEEAFTIIPNFLVTGITAMAVSIFIIIWSVKYVQRKNGPAIFLGLFILLFLVGGGIGQILFFLITWAYTTNIHKTLNWWNKHLSIKIRGYIRFLWPYSLIILSLLFLIALEIAIFGYFPGIKEPDTLLKLCWSFLLIALLLINLTYISGYTYDLETHRARH